MSRRRDSGSSAVGHTVTGHASKLCRDAQANRTSSSLFPQLLMVIALIDHMCDKPCANRRAKEGTQDNPPRSKPRSYPERKEPSTSPTSGLHQTELTLSHSLRCAVRIIRRSSNNSEAATGNRRECALSPSAVIALVEVPPCHGPGPPC